MTRPLARRSRVPLTRDFHGTVKARAGRDSAFRAGLLQQALQAVVEGDLPTARVLLRDAIDATTGFKNLSRALGVGEKSLMRMHGMARRETYAPTTRCGRARG